MLFDSFVCPTNYLYVDIGSTSKVSHFEAAGVKSTVIGADGTVPEMGSLIGFAFLNLDFRDESCFVQSLSLMEIPRLLQAFLRPS